MYIETPKPPLLLGFRLTVYPSPQFLQINGRLYQRSLTLQPGHLLISLALTLSVGFSMSITLHAATQARRLLALTAAGLPSRSESHPMDHDSNSSGHTKSKQSVAQ